MTDVQDNGTRKRIPTRKKTVPENCMVLVAGKTTSSLVAKLPLAEINMTD